jgi:hypothetical protein
MLLGGLSLISSYFFCYRMDVKVTRFGYMLYVWCVFLPVAGLSITDSCLNQTNFSYFRIVDRNSFTGHT